MRPTESSATSGSSAEQQQPARRSADVFVGRHEALAAVRSCAADAEVGRSWVVVVEGPAGVGKSAFVRRAVAALTGFVVVEAAADELAMDESMWLFGQIAPVDSSTSPFAAAMGLLDRLAERQADGPVVLVVEDLHWADGPSRRALLTALQRLQGDRVLVVMTARPERRPDDATWAKLLDDSDRCLRLSLGALSAADVRELASRLDVPLGPNAAMRLHRHTDGHALWVRTLLRELTPAELNAFGALPAPRSLVATTLARVAGLPATSIDLIRALAVLGRPVPLVQLGQVAGVADPTEALDGALSTGFIEWSPSGSAKEVRFTHPLFASAVLADIPPVQRRQMHRTAADADPVRALSHRLAAADAGDESLAVELEAAAANSPDPSVAARWLVAAAEVSEQSSAVGRRLIAAGRARFAIGDVQGVSQLQPRLEVCPPSGARDMLLGWVEWQRGDLERAEQLLATAAGDTNAEIAAVALLHLGSMYAFQGRGRDAIEAGRAALALGSLGPSDEEDAWRVVCAGVGQAEGGVAAVAVLDETFLVSGATPDELSQGVQRTYAVSEAGAGRPAAALLWFDRMMSRPPLGAEAANLAHSHMARAMCHFRVGAWDAALVHAHTAIDLAVDEAQRWVLGHVHAVAAWVHAGRGEWELAERRLEHARSAVEAVPIAFAVIRTRMAEALVGRARGDAAAVVEALWPLTADGAIVTPAMSPLDHWPPLIQALIDLGHADEAADELSRMRRAASERNIDLRMQELTIEARLHAMSGEPAAATAAYEAAVGAAGPESDFLDQVELRRWFGRHLRALGRRREAIVQLAAAHTMAADAAATPFIERIETDLRGSEANVSPVRADALGTLTARERDVVTLIAAGSTNREAATSLYVSVKAVEYHLGNVYAKLHIGSRRELKALVTAT